ncbi:MAG: transposase [Chloroflexi bacterium]|uniref:Mutator family transposase n=1 Tax=Candidatus Chlorohelix allophototropha TaxID=3003348 RepID=A0A8T7M679_9CHLR|nr:transposase [Chloroflexota bacterium]
MVALDGIRGVDQPPDIRWIVEIGGQLRPIVLPALYRNGEFEPTLLKKYGHNTNELEEKILGLYGKGLSIRDLQETLQDLYGVEISPATISAMIWPMVEAWQNRSLARSSIWTPSL